MPCGLAWSDSYQWGYMTYVVREACSALASHTSAQSVPGVLGKSKRHGTTTLFAALNVLNGAVLAACKPRHRHQEFLSFLREIDKAVPAELDIHCIVDNYATHSHPRSRLTSTIFFR